MSEIAYPQCRVYGHKWDSVWVEFRTAVYVECLVCDNCETERLDYVKRRTGFIHARRYKYPSGYQVKGGVTKEARGKMHIAILDERTIETERKRARA